MRARSIALALLVAGAMLLQRPMPASAAQPQAASNDDVGCGMQSGTLTMLATDNESDFAAFALYDGNGKEMAHQYIPLYSSDASAELMLTSIGFGNDVATVKCQADSALRRCRDATWPPVENGVSVALSGVLLGSGWAAVAIKARYETQAHAAAVSLDGSVVGFQLDGGSVRWSSFYDSQNEASQDFFGIGAGDHTLTIGSRDPASGAFVPQDRVCFNV